MKPSEFALLVVRQRNELQRRIVEIAMKAEVKFPEPSWNNFAEYMELCDKIEAKFVNAAAHRESGEADGCPQIQEES
jgi:hypothetical protein